MGLPLDRHQRSVVRYNGVEYDGIHESLVSEEDWERVQQVLASHINGERTLKHPHYLKSTIYCGECGCRMIVSNEKKKNGTVYPYFVCGGRHSKRFPDCKMKAVLIDVVEKKIEEIYDSLSMPREIREQLQTVLNKVIENERKKFAAELDGLQREKVKLEHQRKKLLEAHYNDAIPLDLMKSEQREIAKKLAVIEHDINMHGMTFDEIIGNLDGVMELIEDCGKTYRNAPPHTKRLLNQAIFERFLIFSDDTVTAEPELAEPFKKILEPIKTDLAVMNEAKHNGSMRFAEIAQNVVRHIRAFFRCGDYLEHEKSPYSSDSNFFELNSSSKDFLVDLKGLEPSTSRMRTERSPS